MRQNCVIISSYFVSFFRFASARPKTADKLSMSLDVGNMGAVDYRSGSGQMPPSTSANPYLMPPQMSGAAGRDVSKSYAHFSYKPMHSTIEEGNEEVRNYYRRLRKSIIPVKVLSFMLREINFCLWKITYIFANFWYAEFKKMDD